MSADGADDEVDAFGARLDGSGSLALEVARLRHEVAGAEIRAPTITSLTSASVVAPMAIVMSLVSLNSKGSSLAVMRMKATGIFEPVVGRA